jgi:hypothetical protein
MPDSRGRDNHPTWPNQPEPSGGQGWSRPGPEKSAGWAPGYGQPDTQYGNARPGPPRSQLAAWDADTAWRPVVRRGVAGKPRPRWLLPAVAALALILACGGATLLLSYAAAQATRPIAAARQYCAALQARQSAAAYTLTASPTRKQQSQAQFTTEAQFHDGVDGKVTRCAPTPASRDTFRDAFADLAFLLSGAQSSTVTVTITRARLGTRAGVMTMTAQGDTWLVASLDTSLQGTPLGPLLLADHFCRALAADDFKTAFGDLSAHQIGLEKTEANFARDAALPTGAKYTGCAPDFTTYRLTGATASVKLALNIKTTTPAGTAIVPVPTLASFVLEKGAWKLDGLDPAPSGG